MEKRLLVFLLVYLFLPCGLFAESPAWKQISRDLLDVRDAVCDYSNSNIIYIGTSSGIFKTVNQGEDWRLVLAADKTNRIYIDLFNPKGLYAATTDGLWQSIDAGQNWKRIFRGKNSFERCCLSFLSLPGALFVGTQAGLFSSTDKARSWHRVRGFLANTRVMSISSSGASSKYIYAASTDGVFVSSDKGITWDKVYASSSSENPDAEHKEEDFDEVERVSIIRYVSVEANNDKIAYMATAEGVYRTLDFGLSWEHLTNYGLLSENIHFVLALSGGRVYALTKTGLFLFNNNRWQEQAFGLPVSQIRSVYSDTKGRLYLATDRGLFMNQDFQGGAKEYSGVDALREEEPDINKVQEAAIEYAEVNIKKIKDWRRQAKMRAFLPKVTVDFDYDRNKTVSTNTWGIYSSYSNGGVTAPARHYVGPDDNSRYYNNNWGVSLIWELGDLIWSEAQTSIDVRSRLMVQLRDDILDEVTKLYFERIRVKRELENLGLEDRKRRSEKELKVAELTASIDALTGGYFSNNIRK